MEILYPKGPESVPENLTKPTSKYRLHAWLALGGLCLFVLLYFWLIYFFASTSVKSFLNMGTGSNPFLNLIVGVVMAFLALFLTKALFFIKRFDKGDDFEITAKQEPELFKFINEVADNAGAPRPHRVYLSPRVNASVFYDLSIINLVFPTKKNLEIGLGLVNALTLNEFKAVLAHEFGHFAQKTMAVGRWVYISRQIASHIVGARDWFDKLIKGISSVDLRIAWIGWILSIFVWAIRSLMDTLFTIVILAERALSREMEFNADLVAVSLTGSDAIVNGLYRLEAADNAWDQAVQYGVDALYEGKAVKDVFNLQKYFTKKIGIIIDKPDYGNPPVFENDSSQRIFKKNLASPPKMWSTHPSGFEREENAKRLYISAPNDERSSWILFKDAEELKQKMTKHLYKNIEIKDKQIIEISNELAIEEIDKRYNKVFYNPKYRGYYLKYPLARDVTKVDELFAGLYKNEEIHKLLEDLYPESLTQELELFENRNEEIVMLQALYDKVYDAPGGVILHEGKKIKRKELPELISRLKSEVKDQQQIFLQYNRKLRSLHFIIGESFDTSWGDYLKGLVSLIHYSEHSIAIIADYKRVFDNTLRVILADGNVSSSEMNRLLSDARNITQSLEVVYNNTSCVNPGDLVLARMNSENWSSMLEEFKLGYANSENINGWIGVVDGWINLAVNSLDRLKDAALEELIFAEEKLASAYLTSVSPGVAPSAPNISHIYPILLNGNESKIELKLNLWDRFYSADGLIPTIARFSVAASIIGVALFAGRSVTETDVIIYNGLSTPVSVSIADDNVKLEPMSNEKITISVDGKFTVESRAEDGTLIERFEEELNSERGTFVYNVASAAAMQELTIYYTTNNAIMPHDGPQQYVLGAPRWFKSNADYLFEDAPESIKMKGSIVSKSILMGIVSPATVLSLARDKKDSLNLIRNHILWDDSKSENIVSWLSLVSSMKDGDTLLAARLKRNKSEVITLRSMQDVVSEVQAKKVCRDCEARYKKDPENADLYYLAIRCMEDGPEQDNAFIDGYRKWPGNAWLSLAGGYALTSQENWVLAEKALRNAIDKEPSLNSVCVDIARIHKLNHNGQIENTCNSDYLNYIAQLESGTLKDSVSLIYSNLSKGYLNEALKVSGNSGVNHSYALRQIAASDGASEGVVEEFLQLSTEEGLNRNSIAPTIGLLARKGKDINHYMTILQTYLSSDFDKFDAFVKSLQNGEAPEIAEETIKSLSIQTKGYAYVLGAVYLGDKSPKSWKEKADKMLFVTERPYFVY
ncbi:MAG: M48 family metallopeptidase [Sporocytophaga sp.]|nr:M48 family metallopeptidase [Sporocytophaga sp.]